MAFLAPILLSKIFTAIAMAVISTVINLAISMITAPKKPKGPQRQGSVLELSFGENPREIFVGVGATGGQAILAYNHDDVPDDNAFEVWVLKFSDGRMLNLEGFIIGENYYGWDADGGQASFNVGGTDYLEVYFRDGSAGQTPPAALVASSEGQYLSTDTMTGCAHVIVRYKGSETVWSGGRPRFRWYVQGDYCFDPRDDVLFAGAQDRDDPTTWGPSANPIIIALNYRHGFYNNGELVCGRGIPWDQAIGDRDELIASANICDEAVTLKAGGTQVRYKCGLLIGADEGYGDVLNKLAAACGGEVVVRRGRMEIIPGAARTPHAGFTDLDLVVGEPIEFSPFLSDSERVNTVIPRYPEGENFWDISSAPMRRVLADLEIDGNGVAKPYELELDLEAVPDGVQAQRIGEIRRRQARLERAALVTLPPRFINLEVGDWIPWTSARYLDGATVMFRVMREELRVDRTQRVTLREISEEAYEWDPAIDEIEPGNEILPGADFVLAEDTSIMATEDGDLIIREAA